MLENEPNDREVNDGSGAPDDGAVSTGTGRARASSRPAGPPDPVGPATPPGTAPAGTAPAGTAPAGTPPPPAVSFQPPQVLFQPPPVAVSPPGQATQPDAQAPAQVPAADAGDEGSRRAGTRRRSGGRVGQAAGEGTPPAAASSDAAAGESGDSGDSGPDEADDGTEDGTQPGGRRRRRRGGRSRTRGRGGNGEDGEGETDGGPEGRSAGDAGAGDVKAGDEIADDDTGADDGDDAGDDDNGGAQGRRRRRKRRRGSSGDTERGGTEDDPPDTVVHVREPRAAASRPADDVRAIKGSTRLEAKRQRRREGRESGRRRPPVVTEAEFLARREAVERTMVVRQRGDRTQIAVLEDGILVEHYVNRASHQSYVGNVYLGKVQNVLPSMEAAFVDIGKGRNAVLYAGEVNFDASGLEGHSKRIESALKSGQSILVQVTKDPVGHKGARLTSQVSLPGRYLVYVPAASMTGISRKLPDTERTRLKKILKKIMPEDAGVIVRTAAEGATEEELERDVARLAAQWENIERKAKTASAPELLYGEPDLTVRVIRDVFNEDFSQLIVAGEGGWAEVDEYVSYVAPHLAGRLSRWDASDGRDAFAEYRIDEQLTKALDRKVWLPSGGSLVIDRTEAMTVVDVNTGKFTGQGGNLEETVTRNNLEAAEEMVRQLRLRDVGGIIVIDFIDMVLESNRELVLRRLLECLARDRTKHQVAEVTSLGLVQMTRKRVGAGLLEAFSVPCECCNGRGVHVSLDLADLGQSGEPAPGHSRGGRSHDSKPGGHGSNGNGNSRKGRNGEGRRQSDESTVANGAAPPEEPAAQEPAAQEPAAQEPAALEPAPQEEVTGP
ncbi:MAG: Rne/Rng family ribonuclease [Streptosporangiaceae bacterium]